MAGWNWNLFAAALILFLVADSSSMPDDLHNDTEPLDINRMLINYDRRMPPGRPVVVDAAIRPITTIDVDVENGLLTVDVWLTYSWEDNRLRWDPAEYGGEDILRFTQSQLFIPDIVLYYGNLKPLFPDPDQAELLVYYTGDVSFVYPVRVQVYCDLPTGAFRNAICNITVGPWTRDASYIIITSANPIQDSSPRLQTGRCSIGRSHMRSHNHTYECCPEVYSSATLYLTLGCHETARDAKAAQSLQSKRVLLSENSVRGGSALPLALTPFFVLLVFLMPPKATDRILVGAMVFLFLLIIWSSERMAEEQESFLRLSASTTVAATFISLVSCRMASVDMTPSGADTGEGKRQHRYKTRLATMLDLIMFAAVAVVLGLATVGTFT